MSEKHDEKTWLITGSLVILATAAIAVVLRYTRGVMIPFVLAVFIVQLVSPILDFQVIHLRLPRAIAWVVTFVVVIVIMVLFGLLVAQAVQTIIARAGTYSEEFIKLAEEAFLAMDRWGIDLTQEKIISNLRNRIPSLATNTLGTVFGLSSSFLFVLVFAGFLLAGRNPYRVRSGVYADIDYNVRRYIAIKVVVSTLTGLLVWVSLSVIGLELAGVFGILAFFLNFIPSIGSIVSTLLPIPIAVAQFQAPWPVILVVAVPGIIQTTIGNVVEPKLMGKELNLHPVTVLLALSFWGLLWGIVGMCLAAPMTAVIRIVLMQFDTFKPLARLLAGELPRIGKNERATEQRASKSDRQSSRAGENQ